ncbi:DUF6493 family protein [Kitasatospora sp. A2-31]|uniref:DUF7824 domain-containing protein n=1 Tax=Kitasatospora sp. A2-31 TaxID=2916414 RepID=UPI001EEAA8E2|nr:DUF6493 family protein [Kitasatospora sp. A2-31]MCG6496080.1 DUF6493 family protein [Kitasatospora sp. A2-31]
MSGVEELLTAVREGRTPQVPALVAALGPVERRACLPALKELRKEVRGQWSKEASARSGALLVAGAGCHAGPAGAAGWINGRDFAERSWARHPALAEVVRAQPVEWQVEVATRLAARRGSRWSWDLYPLIAEVVRRTGCPVPATDAFTAEWLDQLGAAGRLSDSRTLQELMTADAFTPVLLPRVFELEDVGRQLEARHGERPGDGFPAAVAMLATSGTVDRAELLDRCLARLVRGGKPADQRGFLGILTALAPDDAEYRAHARSLVAMLDGLPVVAGHAQQVLARLDERGLVEPELLAEASAVVLFRTEKSLVRAQLGWLDRAAKRAPERAGPVVLAAAEAFAHPDTALQERALNIVARHLAKAGEAVLPELRVAAEGLNPAHHARAGEVLGAPVGDDGDPDAAWSEPLPPAPVPRPLGAPIATPAEVAEELSALLAAGGGDVVDFERTLDGLVRHAHRDHAALAEALEPVLRVHTWNGAARWLDCSPADVLYVAAAIAGHVDPHRRGTVFRDKGRDPLRGDHNTPYGNVLAARLAEAAQRVTTDRPPLLLATPTDATGAVAAAELVERIAAYEAAGARPGTVDLQAALLRLAPTAEPAVLADAGRLASPAGRWVAQWLCDGGLRPLPSERVVFAPVPGSSGSRLHGPHYWERSWEDVDRVLVAQPGVGAGPQGPAGERLGGEFRALLDATEPSIARARKVNAWLWPTVHWVAMLPHHREEQTARWLDWFAGAADREQRGVAGLLPILAEAGGPAGLAVHLAVAYGLGARFPEDRTAAVDALLVLAARGDLDAGLLGRELGHLVARDTVKPNRLGQALAAAAETGAYATVWSVLAPVLPALLAGEPARGAGEVLAVAADAARRCRARGPVAEVDAVAARPGSSRLVKEARSLRDVLAG